MILDLSLVKKQKERVGERETDRQTDRQRERNTFFSNLKTDFGPLFEAVANMYQCSPH